jgi:protein TonB
MKKIYLLVLLVAFVSINAKSQSWGDSSVKHQPLFYSVEKAPRYPGGMHAFYQFIANNLQMPENKFSVGSNKLVIVRIVISENGKLVFADIEKGLNANYNNAALSLVKQMPDWSAGLQNGHPVPTSVSIPIAFID